MKHFVEGITLPFRFTWLLLRAITKLYFPAVRAIGPPWEGMIHSTVFFSIGQGIVWLVFLRK